MTYDLPAIGSAIAKIPSGCAILTVQHDGHATGVLVSWVQQAAFEPPCITVGLKRGRPALELIDAAGRFVLNVIGDEPAPMFKHFGRGFTLDQDAFVGLQHKPSEFGPILGACIAHLGCRVLDRLTVGDHELYAAEVAAAGPSADGKPYVHLRKSGLSY